jgi:hypothetical protein
MTVMIQGSQLRTIEYGTTVQKTAANLPATATLPLFTITGGRILVTSLVAEVTTIVQAQACLVKFVATPTTGSAVDMCINTAADITGLEVGAKITLPPTVALKTVIANAGSILISPGRGDVVAIGSIGLATSATNTGALKYTLTYIPYDDAATVVAA